MNNREIVIGTRGSKLALVQTQIVVNNLLKYNPDLNVKIQVIKTSGDRGNLTALGAFVGEIEKALLNSKIDIAIHSLKDMPAVVTTGLQFSAILKRADVREALILKKEEAFDPQKKYTLGTGSPRRELLLKHHFHKIKVVAIRGNVDTRVGMVDSGKLDGVILAAAGLIRIGMEDRITEYLSVGEFIPPPGQGAMAVQTRVNDSEMIELVKPLDDKETRLCTQAEHLILKEISGGCSIPLGAYAQCHSNDTISMIAFYGYNKKGQINFKSANFKTDDMISDSQKMARHLIRNYSE